MEIREVLLHSQIRVLNVIYKLILQLSDEFFKDVSKKNITNVVYNLMRRQDATNLENLYI